MKKVERTRSEAKRSLKSCSFAFEIIVKADKKGTSPSFFAYYLRRDSMEIRLPYHLKKQESLSFCEYLANKDYSKEEELVYIAKRFGVVEPFGMLLMVGKLRELKRNNPHMKLKYRKFSEGEFPASYPSNMGFYQSIGMRYGKAPGESPGGNTYVPITRIKVEKIIEQARAEKKHIGDIVTEQARQMAKILYTGDNTCIDHMTFAIREILRNVIEHSKSPTIWYAGQAWPTKDLVEIAILDEGVGVQKTINSNLYYKKIAHNNINSLRFSLEPGITHTFSPKRVDIGDDWVNTGFGLYMTSNICSSVGDFIICSGTDAIMRSGGTELKFSTSIQGTAIRLRFRLSELCHVTQLRKKLIREGEIAAKKNNRYAIKQASTASKLNYMK